MMLVSAGSTRAGAAPGCIKFHCHSLPGVQPCARVNERIAVSLINNKKYVGTPGAACSGPGRTAAPNARRPEHGYICQKIRSDQLERSPRYSRSAPYTRQGSRAPSLAVGAMRSRGRACRGPPAVVGAARARGVAGRQGRRRGAGLPEDALRQESAPVVLVSHAKVALEIGFAEVPEHLAVNLVGAEHARKLRKINAAQPLAHLLHARHARLPRVPTALPALAPFGAD